MPRHKTPGNHRAILFGLMICAAGFSGCVHRRMSINSNPPGALVLLEGEEVGYTPMSLDFTYYGTRELTLIKDGFKTLTVMQKVPAPWYQRGPMEFVTDNLALTKINNRHEFTYALEPQEPTSSQDLLQRANGLKSKAQMPESN
ncbi:MAG: PEGA domain-containing protein [Planctomycetales bacterium]